MEIACDAPENMYCAAAKAGNGETLLYIAYFNDDAGLNACPPADATVEIELGGAPAAAMTVQRVDDDHDFEEEAVTDGRFTMRGNSFALVRIG